MNKKEYSKVLRYINVFKSKNQSTSKLVLHIILATKKNSINSHNIQSLCLLYIVYTKGTLYSFTCLPACLSVTQLYKLCSSNSFVLT